MHLKIAYKNLVNQPIRSLLIIAATAISMTALTFLLALNFGIRDYLFSNSNQTNPLNWLEIRPAGQIGSNFNIIDSVKPKTIKPEDLTAIEAIPNIEAIFPQSSLKGISSIQVNLLGQWLQSDTLIFGLPQEVFQDDIEVGSWDNFEDKVPIVVSSQLLDLYNFAFANVNNLPRLNKDNLIGTDVKILLNQSTFFGGQNSDIPAIDAEIVGFSNRVKLTGITIPSSALQQFNQQLGVSEDNIINVIAIAENQSDIKGIKKSINQIGLEVTSTEDSIAKISHFFQIFSIALSSIVIVILILTAMFIASTFLSNLNERVADIGILKAIGYSQKAIKRIFLIEAAIIGAIGGFLGFTISWIIALITDIVTERTLTDLINKPDSLFIFNPGLLFFALIFSIFFCLLFAYLPAKKASKLHPIQALSR